MMIGKYIGRPVRGPAGSLAFHASFALVAASPWLLECSGALDLLESLCNWRGCGFEDLAYWMGGRA